MTGPVLATEQILSVLTTTPPRLDEITAGLTAAQLRAAPEPGEWSAVELLAHLRACSDVWGGCIALIFVGERPSIRAVNPRAAIEDTDYRSLGYAASRAAYGRQRDALLLVLQGMSNTDWERSAAVTGGGAPREVTVHSYAQRLSKHERSHIKQFVSIAQAARR